MKKQFATMLAATAVLGVTTAFAAKMCIRDRPQTQNHIVLKTMNGDELGTLLYAKSYDAETKQLSMITVQQFGEGGKLQQVENADTAIWNGQYWVMPVSYTHLDVYKRQVLVRWL